MKRLGSGTNVPRGTALVGKAIAVLGEISRRHHTGLTLTEIARACGFDHSTAHRILARLVAEALIARLPQSKRYVIGPLAAALGAAVHPSLDLSRAALPGVVRLARSTGGTAFLNMRSGPDTVCLAREEGRLRIHALAVEVGARRPLAASAGGVAILLALPGVERPVELRRSMRGLADADPARARAVRAMVRQSLERGTAMNVDRIIPGITAVGVAILDAGRRPIGALSVASYSERLGGAALAGVVATMREEARAAAARLGSA